MTKNMALGFGYTAVLGTAVFLSACSTSMIEKKEDFKPSSAHLVVAPSINTDTQSSYIRHEVPQRQELSIIEPIITKTLKEEHEYQVSVVNAPLRSLLQKFALDAGFMLDLDASVKGTVTLQIQGNDAGQILLRMCDQAGLIAQPLVSGHQQGFQIRADLPHWINYPMDYVNLDRQVTSSMMVANALGSVSGRSAQAINLGGQSNTAPVAVNTGSSVAILNQSKNDVWNSVLQGLGLVLHAKHPELMTANTAPTVVAPTTTDAVKKSIPSDDATALQTEVMTEIHNYHIASVYPNGTKVQDLIHVSREGGFIAVFATAKTHQDISEFVQKLQSSIKRQVMIEATILEVELNDEHQSGVNWQALVDGKGLNIVSAFVGRDQNDFTSSQSAGLVSVTGSAISKDFSLSSTLKLLERYGQSRVLSSPKLMTMNNQPSLIKVVKNLIYFTMQAQVIAGQTGQASTRAYISTPNTVPIGLVMSVIPSIGTNNNDITLAVRPTISSLSGVVDDPNPDLGTVPNRVPIVQERELESVLKLSDGQVAVLGGLIQDVVAEEDTGIPGLVNDSPSGFLFGQKNKAKRKSELVVFLKPTLIPVVQTVSVK